MGSIGPVRFAMGSALMSVVVHLVNGTSKEYPRAEAANLQSPHFVVSRWDPKRRKFENLAVLRANQVTLAEVFDRQGILEHLIAGEGRRNG